MRGGEGSTSRPLFFLLLLASDLLLKQTHMCIENKIPVELCLCQRLGALRNSCDASERAIRSEEEDEGEDLGEGRQSSGRSEEGSFRGTTFDLDEERGGAKR